MIVKINFSFRPTYVQSHSEQLDEIECVSFDQRCHFIMNAVVRRLCAFHCKFFSIGFLGCYCHCYCEWCFFCYCCFCTVSFPQKENVLLVFAVTTWSCAMTRFNSVDLWKSRMQNAQETIHNHDRKFAKYKKTHSHIPEETEIRSAVVPRWKIKLFPSITLCIGSYGEWVNECVCVPIAVVCRNICWINHRLIVISQ